MRLRTLLVDDEAMDAVDAVCKLKNAYYYRVLDKIRALSKLCCASRRVVRG